MKVKRRCTAYILSFLCFIAMVGIMVFHVKRETLAKTVLTGYNASQIVQQMGVGWNLGNTFDATGGNAGDIYSYEQSWGNPIVTKALIQAVKNAGFTTIRIPVTWYRHLSSDGNYTIDTNFIARVKTVVDYAYDEGLFIILNVHHEEWLNTAGLPVQYEQIGKELSAIWSQLAFYFADYDQHLIFEGMNEPRMSGTNAEWTGTGEAYAAVNYLNQIFVSVVRSSDKGYNQERCLMIPGYAASSSETVLRSISIPTVNGQAVNNLIISVHCYSPYNFCLSDIMKDFNPNSPECTGEIDTLFQNLQTIFLDNGIPVVIGETGATNKNNTSAREKWAYYMGNKAAAYGIPIVLWDNGVNSASGGECHSYINRSTAQLNYPTIIQSLMNGKNSVAWGSGRTKTPNTAESLIGGSVIWADSNGLTSTNTWDSSYIVMAAKQSYYTSEREIAVVYTGSGEPKMILDSAEKSAWWIPVDPDRIQTVNGKKVAYFTYDDMLRAMKNNGVNQPSQLRNMCILAVNGNITTYEVSTVGGSFVVTYKVNGADYYIGTGIPQNPTYKNMEFAGWYTTVDYQTGTEYTGGSVAKDMTVYAKFQLTLSFQPYQGTSLPEPTKAPTVSAAAETTKSVTESKTEPAQRETTEKETEDRTEPETDVETKEPAGEESEEETTSGDEGSSEEETTKKGDGETEKQTVDETDGKTESTAPEETGSETEEKTQEEANSEPKEESRENEVTENKPDNEKEEETQDSMKDNEQDKASGNGKILIAAGIAAVILATGIVVFFILKRKKKTGRII